MALSPDVRRRIEEAVLEIFSQRDFHEASLQMVARKARVGFGTIYNYYGSKEGLLFSCVESWTKLLDDRITDHLMAIKSPKDTFRKIFWVTLDFWERNPDIGRIIFLTLPRNQVLGKAGVFERRTERLMVKHIEYGQKKGVLNPKVPPQVLMSLIWGTIMRLFILWIYQGQKESLTRYTEEVFDMIWRGMSNPARSSAENKISGEQEAQGKGEAEMERRAAP